MKRKLKKIIPFGIALNIFLMPCQNVYAGSVPKDIKEGSMQIQVENNSFVLTDDETAYISVCTRDFILKRYGDQFSFDNFSSDFEKGNSDYVNFDIVADMTYIENPYTTDYVNGMREAIAVIEDAGDRAIAEQIKDIYIKTQMDTYLVPEETGFRYQIKMPSVMETKEDLDKCILCARTEIGFGNDLVSPICSLGDISNMTSEEAKELSGGSVLTREDGWESLFEELEGLDQIKLFAAETINYNCNAAVTYAKNHAKDKPEFSKDIGQSDCANFVSACIHKGGIPYDKAGEWYPSTYKDIGYPGNNWMRTGFNNNGGVKTYLADTKKYFKKVTKKNVKPGGFLYWNDKSHVALVVSNSGGNLKYSQHSNEKQDKVVLTYNDKESITCFNPNSSTINVTW